MIDLQNWNTTNSFIKFNFKVKLHGNNQKNNIPNFSFKL